MHNCTFLADKKNRQRIRLEVPAEGSRYKQSLTLRVYRIFASVPNSDPNSVFVFGRIVSSEQIQISWSVVCMVQLVTFVVIHLTLSSRSGVCRESSIPCYGGGSMLRDFPV